MRLEKKASALSHIGRAFIRQYLRISAKMGLVVRWLASGPQLILLLVTIPFLPIVWLCLALTYPTFGAISAFLLALGFAAARR